MKKLVLSSILSTSMLFGFPQGWQATNLTNVTYLAITELEAHNDDLYAVVFNGFAGEIFKLDAGQTSWTSISPVGATGIPSFMKSTGSKFYMGTVGLLESNLYSSTDGVNYSLADTTGLPQVTGGFIRMYGISYFNGKLLLNLGSSGYWIRDESQGGAWTHIDVSTSLNGGGDPLAYLNGKLFAYDNSGTHTFYKSDNYGTSWTTPTTDLQAGFTGTILIADEVNNRLYLYGGNNGTETRLFYSDNEGTNWTEINISQFVTTDQNGGLQTITAMYAKGNTFYFSLENDMNMSHPNIVGTTTGLQNLAVDTAGLPPTATGGVNALYFTEYQGKLAMSLNVIDVYLRGVGTSVEETISENHVGLYPNPANDFLNISSTDVTITSYDIIDINGKVISRNQLFNKTININELSKGIYCIRLYSGNTIIGTKKFIKE